MSKASHEIPFILWTWGSITVFIRYHQQSLLCARWIPSTPSHHIGKTVVLSIQLNMWFLPFGVSSQKPVWISVVHHVSHTPIYLIICDFVILKVCVQVYKWWNSCLCNLSNLLFLPLGVQMASSPPYSWTSSIYVLTKNYIPIKYICIHTHMCTHKFRWEGAQFLMIRDFTKFCKCSENHCW
jgi:hypothetical protein